ncbi:hypothetical protein JP39_02670 [Companilactobacillus heilongjiangensis]|uniref:Uncharacterized protein n=1 Tax=Companilactobacillus heilongjiangensis TaxID=1074467 RepID=A0A0K2LAS9_9LACO|nr:hypothetical protein JP39_02670 [Companilactobacillus heilongjiangensis]
MIFQILGSHLLFVFLISNIIKPIKKLVGRAEHIHLQRKWRYGFSHYTTGRVGDFPYFGKASTEVRDRTVARTVPRSRMNMLGSGNGILK